MIAAGEHVQAVAKQFFGKLRGDAETAGRIFGVGDTEVDVFGGNDVAKMPCDNTASGGGKYIPNKEQIGQDR
jgi:hypothetical protein